MKHKSNKAPRNQQYTTGHYILYLPVCSAYKQKARREIIASQCVQQPFPAGEKAIGHTDL